jgi:DNA-binding XRE family transcriptional regulator
MKNQPPALNLELNQALALIDEFRAFLVNKLAEGVLEITAFPEKERRANQLKTFGIMLHDAREKSGLTITELAKLVPCSSQALSQTERGRNSLGEKKRSRVIAIIRGRGIDI